MATSEQKFVRVVSMGIKDAVGLGRGRDGGVKPSMEDVLNRLFVQGFRLAQEVIINQDMMIAILTREFSVPKEEVPAPVVQADPEVTVTPPVSKQNGVSQDLGSGEIVS